QGPQHGALAQAPLPAAVAQRALGDGLLRDPAQPRRRDRDADRALGAALTTRRLAEMGGSAREGESVSVFEFVFERGRRRAWDVADSCGYLPSPRDTPTPSSLE